MSQEAEKISLIIPLTSSGSPHPKTINNNPLFFSQHEKLFLARSRLEKLSQKFYRFTDTSLFRELDRIIVNLDADFVNQRSADYLAKLAYFIHFIRKNLYRNIILRPLDSHHDIRLFPLSLQFPFNSKPVLGVLAHIYLKAKYETSNEDYILFAIRKSVSEAQLVKSSVYTFQTDKNAVKTLYFEIDKKSGLPFDREEITRIRSVLKQEIKFCVEQLVPRVFMTQNEEEILRNILTLSHEIHQISDIPQVMILFDQQSSQEVIFTVIVLRVCKQRMSSIYESLSNVQDDFSCVQDRCQIVRYLRKKYPVEANVFKISMIKDASLQRKDLSLNFYLARQKMSQILTKAIGEFRDFNGGTIIKQREALAFLRESFPNLSTQHSDWLETFFYSLSPIEVQAILPIAHLKIFSDLFLNALNSSITKPSDSFSRFYQEAEHLFIMIRIPDCDIKEDIDSIFKSYKLTQTKIVSSIVSIQNTHFIGYLVHANTQIQKQIIEAIIFDLKNWRRSIENRQILKVGLRHSVLSLDPRIGGDQISSILLKMVFEGLMRENKKGKIDYGVAKKVSISPDSKTYLFHLRESRWSNGSFVAAFDFEYAWKKVLSPSFKTPFAYLFYPIKNAKLVKEGVLPLHTIGVKALDERTLQVELESPTPYFLELTAHTLYSPVNRLIDQLNPNWPFGEMEQFVCNGAFQMIKNNQNEGYEFARNPLYWDVKNIQLDRAIFVKTTPSQAYEMFQNDNNHWIGAPLGTWDPSFSPGKNSVSVDFLNNNVYWFVFNNQKFPFNNKKIRKAFAMAIDRSMLCSLFDVVPATTPLPPLHKQTGPSVSSVYNLEKAQALFKEALSEMKDVSQNFPVIPLIYLPGPFRNKIAEFAKHQWERAFGIKCTIEPLEWNTFFPKMTEGDFLLGSMSWQSWINDPLYTLNSFKEAKDPINFAKWENSRYQEILDHAEKEMSAKQRKVYYSLAEEILLEEMPIIPIYFITSYAFKKKNLNLNLKLSSSLLNFKWASLTPSF